MCYNNIVVADEIEFVRRGVAQLVAHVLWEHGAGGSSPFTPTMICFCGPLVKWLRHRPFTEVTAVQVC